MISRRSLLVGGTAAGATLGLGGLARRSSSRRSSKATTTPNVIVVLADDMRYDETAFLPNVKRLLIDDGISFTAARHNSSLCSPARAGFLTGQYSLRHKVRSLQDSFAPNNATAKTVAVWMQDAGYSTGQIGKYFVDRPVRKAPGWEFRRQLAANGQLQYGYDVWDGERNIKPESDQTSYLQAEVVGFLQRAAEPFFLWFTPTASHWPLDAPPGHEDDVADLEWPDLREADVSDKPEWIRALPPLTDDDLAAARANQRLRIQELLGLDDTIGEMFATLDSRGVLDNTVVMFSSDNGVFEGEHRLPLLSKNMPYEASVRSPCLLRAPGLAPGTVTQAAHMTIDLTATCVDVAGASPDLPLDGVSLLEIARRPDDFEDRRLLYDRDDRDGLAACPPAAGVFTSTRKLVRYEGTPPTYELYDLGEDPRELTNVADDPAYAAERKDLEADLDALLES